jgi:hypothetical protein
MIDNTFLPLSFIAGPAILTNGTAVLLNGASIRYNLAIQLWRDLQADTHGHEAAAAAAYADPGRALQLAHRRVVLIVRAVTLLHAAVGGFGLSTLTGLVGAMLASTQSKSFVGLATTLTLGAGALGLVCLLLAVTSFGLESLSTMALLRLGMPPPPAPGRRRDQRGWSS